MSRYFKLWHQIKELLGKKFKKVKLKITTRMYMLDESECPHQTTVNIDISSFHFHLVSVSIKLPPIASGMQLGAHSNSILLNSFQ